MNTREMILALQGYPGDSENDGKTFRKHPRKIDSREIKDPETQVVLQKHQERLGNLLAFSKSHILPNCPKCSARLFFEEEIRGDSRLVCRAGGHSTEVIRVSARHIWVRADFFQLE